MKLSYNLENNLKFWRLSHQVDNLEADVRKWHQVMTPVQHFLIVDTATYFIGVNYFVKNPLHQNAIQPLPFMKFGNLMS